MKALLADKLIALALPLIIGFLVRPALDVLKRGVSWLDNAPASVKQTLAFVIAGLATALAQALGVGIPTDIAQWDAGVVETILAGLLAIALKQRKQVAKLKDAAATIPAMATPRAPVDPNSPFTLP